MWDYDPPPHAQILLFIYVFLLQYIDDILVLLMGMYGVRGGAMYVPHGMETLYVPYATCFREIFGSFMIVSLAFLTPHGMGDLPLKKKLKKKFMEGSLGEHSAHGGGLSLDGVTNGRGKDLQHSLYHFLEDKKHCGGEDCNISN